MLDNHSAGNCPIMRRTCYWPNGWHSHGCSHRHGCSERRLYAGSVFFVCNSALIPWLYGILPCARAQ